MAITYTYSFNCTIKYRLNGEVAEVTNPQLSDSTNLYTCTSTLAPTINTDKKLTVTTPADLTLPLPGYLQGVGDGIEWYLTRDENGDHSNKVTSGKLNDKDLTFENWSIKNAVQTGTFISCDATIILFTDSSKKTIQWKYKKLTDGKVTDYTTNDTNKDNSTTWQPIPLINDGDTEEEKVAKLAQQQRFILENAPKIDPWLSQDSKNNTATLYIFTGWSELTSTDNITYTCTAEYTETTYDKANPYTYSVGENKINIFENAEPYHYNIGAPDDGWFIPIGEDDDDATINDLKVQAPENNGYSVVKSIDNYKINGKAIQYIEKGTFPLTNLLYETPTDNSVDNIEILITYKKDANDKYTEISSISALTLKPTDEEGTYEYIKLEDYATKIALFESNHWTFAEHGHSGKFPYTLGFILSGGGGGGGGMSRYDPKSDGKENDYTIPGGGGGGGQIVCGVIDLTNSNPAKVFQKVYYFSLGAGGSGGGQKTGDASYDSPQKGDAGKNGGNSIISYSDDITEKKELYKVGGGYGGSGAGTCVGGDGGNLTMALNTPKNGCTICKRISGGKGGSATANNASTNTALEFKLYFSTVEPPTTHGSGTTLEYNKFYVYKNHAALGSGTFGGGVGETASIPGGHSFGPGGQGSTSAKHGAGGGCTRDGQPGSHGYFGLFY